MNEFVRELLELFDRRDMKKQTIRESRLATLTNYIGVKFVGLEPIRGTANAAGYDLAACIEDPLVIRPGGVETIPTGTWLEIPQGYFGMLALRSSLGKKGFCMPNAPGIIDSDYRGEVKVLLANARHCDLSIQPGDRIAQVVFIPHGHASFWRVEELNSTARGQGGFGSTGK